MPLQSGHHHMTHHHMPGLGLVVHTKCILVIYKCIVWLQHNTVGCAAATHIHNKIQPLHTPLQLQRECESSVQGRLVCLKDTAWPGNLTSNTSSPQHRSTCDKYN
jgi:hypothetical protein